MFSRSAEEPTMPDVESCFFWHINYMQSSKASEAPQSLGAGETAQCFGHIINSQLARLAHREMCVSAAFHDIVCSSGRISLVWSCD